MSATSTLSPTLIREVRTILEQRDSALTDLRACPAARRQSEWAEDRRKEVEWSNRYLERTAGKLGMTAEGLITMAKQGGRHGS